MDEPELSSLASEREQAKWDRHYSHASSLVEDQGARVLGRELADKIEGLLPAGASVLELGCGAGWQSLALARTGRYKVSLMDFSESALGQAKSFFARENMKAAFICADGFTLGKAEYDLVFNTGVLEHYNSQEQAKFVKGMASRSRKYILVAVPNARCYWYWIWRLRLSSQGEWPYGKEMPGTDLSVAFSAAGVKIIGNAYLGSAWTEDLIRTSVTDPLLRTQLLTLHGSPVIPEDEKGYLLVALGALDPRAPSAPGWGSPQIATGSIPGDAAALLADALALSLNSLNRAQEAEARVAVLVAHQQKKMSLKDVLYHALQRVLPPQTRRRAFVARVFHLLIPHV